MSGYILVDDSFQQQVLKELSELKALLSKKHPCSITEGENPQLMDMVDLQNYLRCCRRTILKHRKNGMPSVQKANGRVYFWMTEIDKYFGKPDG